MASRFTTGKSKVKPQIQTDIKANSQNAFAQYSQFMVIKKVKKNDLQQITIKSSH